MPLNKSKGNMYDFVTHTWNPIKGKCYHDCSYCYMKRWGKQKPVRLDEKELKTDLGENNFIFVGSSCDMFADDIPEHWINNILAYCELFNNTYLFQSKNINRIYKYYDMPFLRNNIICTTLETNRHYPEIMRKAPKPIERALWIVKHITIEPILDFDLNDFINIIGKCCAVQINIGADSGNNNLPEPPKEKILELITELEKFTKVKLKKNLDRLLK